MSSLKPLLFSLVIIFVVVAVVQNTQFFMLEQSLRLDLLVWSGESPAIPLSVYFLAFFLVGFVLSSFYWLSERYKAKKSIQNHLETIRKLEEEVKVLKSLPTEEETAPQEEAKVSD